MKTKTKPKLARSTKLELELEWPLQTGQARERMGRPIPSV
jgi:hypothetical protein